ncbi:hypothetical protein ASPZODRAFT_72236 [Penicilliopsis zonata CBS 506.65]|uniref:glucan 1,3-beta-glucosidase n=1 Tax=Penicilliopsis zonata CBS 506.65 TaxID=1073090 RepID=A0A1L9S9U7_9EURO|nr:hypothetical protein ASPZODRAFT_72236 [Penicilliopsis zonata CBS 506.65]OJJ43972.1 hypothetical protein ASPZODRAFT_72236 [Penicilliopsis zonata CBS 506.65]
MPRPGQPGRIVSGSYLEEGMGPDMNMRRRGGGGGNGADHPAAGPKSLKQGRSGGRGGKRPAGNRRRRNRPFWKQKKWIWVGIVAAVVVAVAVSVPLALLLHKKNKSSDSASSSDSGYDALTANLASISPDSIPASAKGTYLDPYTWYETIGFNITYTSATVGGLSIMGINSTWDDSARPNPYVPPLNESFPYGTRPIRGVNLGGWLAIEPFIVPSLFDDYSLDQGIIDEWHLTRQLGSSANRTIEAHYATFITEEDFKEIAEAGLDHVRLQYSYWAVTTYEEDPYVPKISWRYLLRAIEWARKYGLRVNLDLHGIPGSQNGWNHSGHQGLIRWLNGTHAELNRNRSIEIHDQLSQFFAQDRYKNVVTLYSLVNEPLMLDLPIAAVLNWTTEVTELVQSNGITAWVVFHDGFLNLDKWDYMLKDAPSGMMLDTHQYTIFNTAEVVLNHTAKIALICDSWYPMIEAINVTSTGWGPTICGEWSQADTDCAKYLNDVGTGTRWEGTLRSVDGTAYCPTASAGTCNCTLANADVSEYSTEYKKWLRTYAEAQMSAFETAMGWFYWTWHTESAAQWSYKVAWKNGFMPEKAYKPSFVCGDDIPDFGDLPQYY